MLGKHATNKDGSILVEPAIIEMNEYMRLGKFHIAGHCTELGEEILNYHRQEDWKIVPLRDDLISAVRYAFMSRRSGKPLSECEAHSGWSGGNYYGGHRRRRSGPVIAEGVDFNPFTGL
jgi:hypothetical protein